MYILNIMKIVNNMKIYPFWTLRILWILWIKWTSWTLWTIWTLSSINILDIMDIMDVVGIMNIIDIMDKIDIMDIMDIMNIMKVMDIWTLWILWASWITPPNPTLLKSIFTHYSRGVVWPTVKQAQIGTHIVELCTGTASQQWLMGSGVILAISFWAKWKLLYQGTHMQLSSLNWPLGLFRI